MKSISSIYLESSCVNISSRDCENLMKSKRRASYKRLVNLIKKYIPELYTDLSLNLFNHYEEKTFQTKTHYILTHSGIEFFIRKVLLYNNTYYNIK